MDTAGSVSWYRRSLYFIEAIRTFAQGFFGISFVVEVHIAGMSALAVGMVTTLSVSIGIVITRYIEVVIPRYGTRVAFLGIGVLMIATGSIMSFLPGEIGIALAALFGFLPPLGGQFSAAVAEGALAQTPACGRTKVFALYGLVATVAGASGSLFASLPVLLGANTSQAASILILLLVPLGVLVVIVGFSMPRTNPLFDAGSKKEVSEPPPALDVRKRLVYRLALLFTADSIGSGVVTPTLVLYWLHVYFNLSLVDMSLLYFGMDILSAISFPLAERISRKIGLLNTAVFTHIPSSLLLIAVPFAPNGLVAAMLLLGRSLLVEMDVPTRQSYIASIVPNSMRAFAASRTSIGKQTGRAIGPAIGGTLFSSVATVAPFLTGGVLKICYDVALWSSFRQIKASPSEE